MLTLSGDVRENVFQVFLPDSGDCLAILEIYAVSPQPLFPSQHHFVFVFVTHPVFHWLQSSIYIMISSQDLITSFALEIALFVDIKFMHQLAHLRYIMSLFSVCSQNCAVRAAINFRTFSSSKKEAPNPLVFVPLLSLCLQLPSLLYFLASDCYFQRYLFIATLDRS